MTRFREWLGGKKTYLLAGLLVLAILILLLTGHLSPPAAMALVMIAALGFPVTFRAAIERHHVELLEVLDEIAVTGAALAEHNIPGALAGGEQAVKDGAAVAQECKQEAQEA